MSKKKASLSLFTVNMPGDDVSLICIYYLHLDNAEVGIKYNVLINIY